MQRALSLLTSARFAASLEFSEALLRTRAKTGVDLSQARARSGFGRGHLLDVVVYVPGGTGNAVETEAAELAVRLLLGEELFERWLGRVSATPTVRRGPLTVLNTKRDDEDAFDLALLGEAVHAAVNGLKSGLPARAMAAHGSEEDWLLFELSPEPSPDYAAQDDLLLASTRTPELKKSFLRGEPFFSGRFSRAGELFLYLKYESPSPALEERLREREALEAALSSALAPDGGALIGTGLGLRYAYLDFAVADVGCVQGRVLGALRSAGIAKRAWLLFYDSELDREWIPVHPDGPPPYFG